MRKEFLLDNNIIYLNHGSYGACHKSIFEEYQKWQYKLELQPVEFINKELPPLLSLSRNVLSEFLNIDANDIVLLPNPTTALNEIVRSLDLSPGDEILTTNHEYGAMNNIWEYITKKTGAHLKPIEISIPISTEDIIIKSLKDNITKRTKIIFISHLTSETAMIFPVQNICKIAREKGILSIIDGAHTPGHIPLDISSINPDIYIGTCHKWLCTPKGSAFMYVKCDIQKLIEPLIIGWGWNTDFGSGLTPYINDHEWWGTNDISSYLCIPRAIDFISSKKVEQMKKNCRKMVIDVRESINDITKQKSICPDYMIAQLASMVLPIKNPIEFKAILLDKYNIEIPIWTWNNINFIRVSVQIYNTQEDLDTLLSALKYLINNK